MELSRGQRLEWLSPDEIPPSLTTDTVCLNVCKKGRDSLLPHPHEDVVKINISASKRQKGIEETKKHLLLMFKVVTIKS